MPNLRLSDAPSDLPRLAMALTKLALVGFSVVGPNRDPDAPAAQELFAIYTRAAWWGTGLGQRLWDAVRPGESCSLWVLEDNARARGFYARNGFVPDGARELYTDLGAWEIRMVRP